MSVKVIADVLGLGSRYVDNGVYECIAYRYSDLKQALVELVKATQENSKPMAPEQDYVQDTKTDVPDDLVQDLHGRIDDVFIDFDDIEIIEDI